MQHLHKSQRLYAEWKSQFQSIVYHFLYMTLLNRQNYSNGEQFSSCQRFGLRRGCVCEAITWGALLGLWNPFISWQGIVTQINTCARIHWIKCQKVKFTVEYKINIAYDFLKKWLSGSVWWERRLLIRVCARVWEKSSWRLWMEGWVVWFWSHWTGFWVGK